MLVVMMSSGCQGHLVDQTEPLVHDVLGGGGAVSEAQLGHSHATFGELLSPVELVGGAHQVGDLVLLQQLDVVVHGPVLWLVGDEKAHVSKFNFSRSRPDDFPSHFDAFSNQKFPQKQARTDEAREDEFELV